MSGAAHFMPRRQRAVLSQRLIDSWEGSMTWKTLSAFFLSLAALTAAANIQPFPSSFSVQEIRANGTTVHVRVGGTGPAVVLLHGFADTGDMWAPLAVLKSSPHSPMANAICERA